MAYKQAFLMFQPGIHVHTVTTYTQAPPWMLRTILRLRRPRHTQGCRADDDDDDDDDSQTNE